MRVALLTDIHIGPTVGQKRMETIARLTNDLNPGEDISNWIHLAFR